MARQTRAEKEKLALTEDFKKKYFSYGLKFARNNKSFAIKVSLIATLIVIGVLNVLGLLFQLIFNDFTPFAILLGWIIYGGLIYLLIRINTSAKSKVTKEQHISSNSPEKTSDKK